MKFRFLILLFFFLNLLLVRSSTPLNKICSSYSFVKRGKACNLAKEDYIFCDGSCRKNVVCADYFQAGETCSVTKDEDANSFSGCHNSECIKVQGNSRMCLKIVGLGQKCNENAGIYCNPNYDYQCYENKCILIVGIGQACNENFICNKDSSCKSKVCVSTKIGQIGSPCGKFVFCGQGLVCDPIKYHCIKVLAINTACQTNSDTEVCDWDQNLICDTVNNKCVQDNQDACQTTICPNYFQCSNGKCTYKTCSTHSNCPTDFKCIYGLCVKVSVIALMDSCSNNPNMCEPGTVCSEGQKICSKIILLANVKTENCGNGKLCPPSHKCIQQKCIKCKCPGFCDSNSGQYCDESQEACVKFVPEKQPECPKLECVEPAKLEKKDKSQHICKLEPQDECPKKPEPHQKIDPFACKSYDDNCPIGYVCDQSQLKCIAIGITIGATCFRTSNGKYDSCKGPMICQNKICVQYVLKGCDDSQNLFCPQNYKCVKGICLSIDAQNNPIDTVIIEQPVKKDCPKLKCPSPNIAKPDPNNFSHCYRTVGSNKNCGDLSVICENQFNCINGICVQEPECKHNKPCGKGFICQNYKCIKVIIKIGGTCEKNSDCDTNFCNIQKTFSICAIKVEFKEACNHVTKICTGDLFCNIDLICVKIVRDIGGKCDKFNVCNYDLFCDKTTSTCIVFKDKDCPPLPDKEKDPCEDCCLAPLFCHKILKICMKKDEDEPTPVPKDEAICICGTCFDKETGTVPMPMFECPDNLLTLERRKCNRKGPEMTPGKPCQQNYDCKLGGKCYQGVCYYIYGISQICNNEYILCDEAKGLFCSQIDLKCQKQAQSGEPCVVGVPNMCVKDHICSQITKTCLRINVRLGGQCGPGIALCRNTGDDPLVCIKNICSRVVNPQGPCDCTTTCPKGFFCSRTKNICVKNVEVGGTCEQSENCDPTKGLKCSQTDHGKICLKNDVEFGEPCDDVLLICKAKLFCLKGQCQRSLPRLGECCEPNPESPPCIRGVCHPRYKICLIKTEIGSVCSGFNFCPEDSSCLSCETSDKKTLEVCVRNGEQCPKFQNCPEKTKANGANCVNPGLLGDPCNSSGQNTCESGVCEGGYCVQRLKMGDLCGTNPYSVCDKGLVCLKVNNKKTCVKQVLLGGTCDESQNLCFGDLKCVNSKCSKVANHMEYCDNKNYICNSPSYECDLKFQTTGICAQAKGPGQDCSDFGTICATGLLCEEGYCSKKLAVGEACEQGKSMCPNGFCDPKTNKCVSYQMTGQPCDANKICLQSDICDSICKRVKDIGGTCNNNDMICRNGLTCQMFGDLKLGKCYALRPFKEVCSTKDFIICEKGLACSEKNFRCNKVAKQGEECDITKAIICDRGYSCEKDGDVSKCKEMSVDEISQNQEVKSNSYDRTSTCANNPCKKECKGDLTYEQECINLLMVGGDNKVGGDNGIFFQRFEEKTDSKYARLSTETCLSGQNCKENEKCDERLKLCLTQNRIECDTHEKCPSSMKCLVQYKKSDWKAEPLALLRSNTSHSIFTETFKSILHKKQSEITNSICLFDKALSEGVECVDEMECIEGFSCRFDSESNKRVCSQNK